MDRKAPADTDDASHLREAGVTKTMVMMIPNRKSRRRRLSYGCTRVPRRNHARIVAGIVTSFAGWSMFVSAGVAHAAPGDVVAKRFLKGVATITSTSPAGVPVIRTPSGGYLAFRETWVTAPKAQTIEERRVIAIRKFTAGGRIDRKFERSQIGRGIRVGRKSEFADVRRIEPISGDIYLAWATTNGSVFTGTRLAWPRTWLIAFDGVTGSIIRGFGTKGVLTYGSSGRLFRSKGFSDANALAKLPDGRTATCGEHRISQADSPTVRRPFVVSASIDSKRQAPFLSSGSTTFDVFPDEPDLNYQTCLAAMSDPSGGLVLGGFAAKDRTLGSGRAWLTKFTPAGVIDGTFGVGGRVVLAPGATSDLAGRIGVRAIAVDASGRTYVTGKSISGTEISYVARFGRDGKPDLTFGNDGYVLTPEIVIRDIWISPTGSVMVSGRSPGYFAAVGRLTPEGAWDSSFLGTGLHVYFGAYSFGVFRLPGSSGTQIIDWTETTGKKARQYLVTLE